jgi:oligopeptide/dipeptide ABC transporter ATP-binding protein
MSAADAPLRRPLLQVEGLRTGFPSRNGMLHAVDGVDFSLDRGEILGLVGESGSGKSVTGFSILGLVDPPGRILGGRVLLDGVDLASLDEGARRAIRGKRIAMIFQDPMMTLDVTIQGQILHEMQALVRESGTALVWITHDLSVVAGLADRVCVMYAGRIVEAGPVDAVLDAPRHPYTRGLIDSVPAMNPRGRPLAQIPGNAPSPGDLPPGCVFRTRCTRAIEHCGELPPLEAPADARAGSRAARCWNPVPLPAAGTR